MHGDKNNGSIGTKYDADWWTSSVPASFRFQGQSHKTSNFFNLGTHTITITAMLIQYFSLNKKFLNF